MPERRTQAQRREVTRRAILRAAADRFVDRGIALTSLDDVAAQAGVTKGALYHYFANKDALVAAVISALGTVDAVAATESPTAAEVGRASAAGSAPLLERALNYELFALAARNEEIRIAFGARLRSAFEELAEAHKASTRQVVIAAALHEGLWIHRLLTPDLVTAELFIDAVAALEHMSDSTRQQVKRKPPK